MEQNISLYKQFGLPVREDGGPTYLKCVWQKCKEFANDDVVMLIDNRHQKMPKSKKEAHYAAVRDGKFNCYKCDALLHSGWEDSPANGKHSRANEARC